MLKTLIGIIRSREEFKESAEMIYEDAKNSNIDDFILLTEDTKSENKDPLTKDNTKEEDKKDNLDDNLDDATNNESDDSSTKMEDDLDNLNLDDAESIITDPTEEATPRSKEEELEDIMSITLDLNTNNMSDVIPVTPKGAEEAIVDDSLKTPISADKSEDSSEDNFKPQDSIDDSFDSMPLDDSNDDVVNSDNKDDITTESADSFFEGITFGEDDSSSEENPDKKDKDIEDPDATDEAPDTKNNQVTNAVLDKVAEAEEDTGEPPAEENNKPEDKKDLLKKLSSITDGIEAAKRMIVDQLEK